MSKYFLFASLVLLIGCSKAPTHQPSYTIDESLFTHSVASGDPTSNSVIIWTKLSLNQGVEVTWQVSSDSTFTTIAHEGKTQTNLTSDEIVKVDVTDLTSDQYYYYRFVYEDKSSPIGRTKTFPSSGMKDVKLGVVSCSNYEFGYFGAYHGLAEADLDAILHLGDYIYEYGPNKYGDTSFMRKHLPAHEIITLSDYRTRYAQYREDEGLQRVHQMHPFITIWDDHEITNDSYKDGAQNHQEDEGDYQERKKIAKQAYYEWMPVRPQNNTELYRSFSIGDMVDVIMLDERYTGREEPASSDEEAAEPRSMLGAAQLSWFKSQLSASKAKWKVIGNQVIFSPCDLSVVRPEFPINLDAWDGYAYERDNIRAFLSEENIEDVVFVTGDTHASWAFDIPQESADYPSDGKTCGVEIGTPSITSSNWNESASRTDSQVEIGEKALTNSIPHLKYVNGRDHGYVILTLSDTDAKAQWYYLDDMTIKRPVIRLAKEVAIADERIEVR